MKRATVIVNGLSRSCVWFVFLTVMYLTFTGLATTAALANESFPEKKVQTDPQGLEDLDEALADALKLYYDRQYAKALPIFRRLEDHVENLDMLFWVGICAAKSGQYRLAISKLEKMLLLSPYLHQVRLELAVAYFKDGQLEKARKAFEQVKAASPPNDILKKIDMFLMMIYRQQKTFTWNLRCAQGYQFDTNIASGPGISIINDGIQKNIPIDEPDQKYNGHKWQSDVTLNLLMDPGDPGGLILNNGYKILMIRNSEDDKYNYLNAVVFMGPWWTSKRNFYKMPMGFIFQHYGTTSLAKTLYVNPSAEFFLNSMISLKGSLNYSFEEYIDQEYADSGHDNQGYAGSLCANLYFLNRTHILSVKYTYELSDAEKEMHSYSNRNSMISLFSSFSTDTECYASYNYSDKRYDDSPYNYDAKRKDIRHVISIIAAQNFSDHYFVSLGYDYTQNNSNADLYTFEKNLFSVSCGVKF